MSAQLSNIFGNCRSYFTVSLMFLHLINETAYHLGRYEPSSPSTKELNAWAFTLLSHAFYKGKVSLYLWLISSLSGLES